MSQNQITVGGDGFYHPANEEEIIELVKKANQEALEIRCRGAAHSLARAIYTDPGAGQSEVPNRVSVQAPPKGTNINIMLDNYTQLEWISEDDGIVEVQAGIHLGYDPEDPSGKSTLDNSLLYQAYLKGWTFSDLGGITHQTVSGFLMTGSAGGTLMYSLDENLLALRIINGQGTPMWIEKERDEDVFNAVALSLGLLGIVSKVRLKLIKNYLIYGQQITTPTTIEKCSIDLFGNGSRNKPSMMEFLKKTPYTRILWWPQKHVERVVIWEASRGTAMPVFDPAPYEQFTNSSFITELEQLAGSIMFTTLGNSGFSPTWKKLKGSFKEFESNLEKAWGKNFFAWLFANLITIILQVIFFIVVLLFATFKKLLLLIFPGILNMLQPLTKKGKAKLFMDYNWRSLPMDNGANDILLGTEFTELWVPISETQRAMNFLKGMFDERGLPATGYYSTELYAGIKSNFWLSPAFKEDTFRIDIFWYVYNEGNPAEQSGYYSQFWNEFKRAKIPFRLHWGKFMPEYDYSSWADYYHTQYPRLNDFLDLRKKMDPKNIFLSDYWSLHLLGKKRKEVIAETQPITEIAQPGFAI